MLYNSEVIQYYVAGTVVRMCSKSHGVGWNCR